MLLLGKTLAVHEELVIRNLHNNLKIKERFHKFTFFWRQVSEKQSNWFSQHLKSAESFILKV